MEKIYYKAALFLIIGIGLGFIISEVKTTSVEELKTASTSGFVRDDKSIELTNSLGLAPFDGAWISVGEEMVNKVNSVYIYCWQERKICEVAQANIVHGSFYSDITYYDIIDWNYIGQITAISSTICEDQILKADIRTRVVTLSEAKKNDADKEICVQDGVPMVLKLGSRGYGIK